MLRSPPAVPFSDLLTDVAACQRRKSVIIATTDFISSINSPKVAGQLPLPTEVDWELMDVNLTLRNGRRLHPHSCCPCCPAQRVGDRSCMLMYQIDLDSLHSPRQR